MKVFLLVLEIIVAIALVVAILLHSAKGEGLAGIGGQARVYGTQKGLEDGLNRVTTVLAAIFFMIAGLLGVFL